MMARRIKSIALCALALSIFALNPAAASARGVTKCKPGHSHLLAVDTQAQVYEVINDEGPFREAFGCAYGRRPYSLGRLPEGSLAPESGEAELFTITGTMIAYQWGESGYSFSGWHVLVRNLLTGRWTHIVPTGKPEEPHPDPESTIGPALAIVVKGDGSVAWIAEDRYLSENKPAYYQVHALDKTGSRVLAAGTNIAPTSLALAGSTIYWLQGGKPMSATLD